MSTSMSCLCRKSKRVYIWHTIGQTSKKLSDVDQGVELFYYFNIPSAVYSNMA